MKHFYFLFSILFLATITNAQIKGTVTDSNNETLAFVNVFIADTYIGTTTNEEGDYNVKLSKKGTYNVVFQYLGYKTVKKEITIDKFPYLLNVSLTEDAVSLNTVKISSKDNPANKIIRNAINNRKNVKEKLNNFTADFYSRGLFRVKDAPKKILGQDLGDLGGGLDSTRTGVIYLSETISKITKSPSKFKEKIIASKVSGEDNGFSFNQASDVNYSFYNNTVDLGDKIISPIASSAFLYYRFKLVNTFYEEEHLINKIKVTPKRKTDNAFNGFIYIVEDTWQIFGVDFSISGKQIQQPVIDSLKLKQNYSYSNKNKLWSLFSQSIDFKAGMFGFNMNGRFTAVYNNYNFQPNFNKKTFTNEVLSFEDNAAKKDSLFWKKLRPVPLTVEEIKDYKLKDSVKVIRKSKKYLDSIDHKGNKFKVTDLLFGYNYRNSYKKWNLNIGSPLFNSMFNTVQGWHSNTDIVFYKNYKEKNQRLWVRSLVDYGLSDEQLRLSGKMTYQFNNISRPYLSVSGGRKMMQFNPSEPISPIVNALSSILFEDNYAKYYDKTFAEISYSKEVKNGIRLSSSMAFEDRKSVFNTTDYTIINHDDKDYISNNPLDKTDYINGAIDSHKIYKFNLGARISFAQEYISHPDKKYNLYNGKYPTISLNYTKGFASSDDKYNYDLVKASLHHSFDVSNKGRFTYNINAGKFLNTDELSFVDYAHFSGNQTHTNLNGSYTNSFNLLPYYDFSTNKEYAQIHAQHNFDGYLLRKIPLLNKLQFKTIIGAKSLFTTNNKPYTELSVGLSNIGFGKARFLRIDYVQSYFNGKMSDGFMFGVSF